MKQVIIQLVVLYNLVYFPLSLGFPNIETSNTINTIVTSNQSNEIDYTTTFPVEFEEEFATTPFPDVNLTRIVGGWPAKAGEFPFQVALLYSKNNQQYCGGSIISKNHILTAAHCTNMEQAKDIYVRLGSIYRDKGGIIIPVKEIRRHPQYESVYHDFDIAILVLQTPITFSQYIRPVSLPPRYPEPIVSTLMLVSGWGDIKFQGEASPVLKYVAQQVVPKNKCYDIFPTLKKENYFCAGGVKDEDTCQGDSGGPVIFDIDNYVAVQTGIVSQGWECALEGYPGFYSDVGYFVPWINKQMCLTTP